MLVIRLADTNIEIRGYSFLIRRFFQEYVTDGKTDIIVRLKTKDMLSYIPKCFFPIASLSRVAETCVSDKICLELARNGVFLMHGAVIEIYGQGYMFIGPSGIGKTTRVNWLSEQYGKRAVIIDGDKPLCRFDGNSLIAYGTPWQRKGNLGSNCKTAIKRIIRVVNFSEKDLSTIHRKERYFQYIYEAVCIPRYLVGTRLNIIEFVEKIIKNIAVSIDVRN